MDTKAVLRPVDWENIVSKYPTGTFQKFNVVDERDEPCTRGIINGKNYYVHVAPTITGNNQTDVDDFYVTGVNVINLYQFFDYATWQTALAQIDVDEASYSPPANDFFYEISQKYKFYAGFDKFGVPVLQFDYEEKKFNVWTTPEVLPDIQKKYYLSDETSLESWEFKSLEEFEMFLQNLYQSYTLNLFGDDKNV